MIVEIAYVMRALKENASKFVFAKQFSFDE